MGKKKQKRDVEMPSDADLLVELCTLDEVSAWIPTANEHDAGIVPPWCELVLEINRLQEAVPQSQPGAWPISQRMPLRRHDGELVIQVLWDVLRPDLPASAALQMWRKLDSAVDRIQRRVERGKEPLSKDVAYALAMAEALALMANPLEPDVDQVRADAMDRYEARTPSND